MHFCLWLPQTQSQQWCWDNKISLSLSASFSVYVYVNMNASVYDLACFLLPNNAFVHTSTVDFDIITADILISHNAKICTTYARAHTVVRDYWIFFISLFNSFYLFITVYFIVYCYFYWSLFSFFPYVYNFSLYFSQNKKYVCICLCLHFITFISIKITKESEWPMS